MRYYSTGRRITDAIDGLLGTTSFRGGEVVHNRNGVLTNGEAFELPDAPLDALTPVVVDVDPCSAGRHMRLKGNRRCLGCGRTRNEIEIEEF